ncbi:MAG: hypothetical protein B1H03_06780 [Planctomycetales bacterium 4484_113]|nr:MAG: hypothetical protein B1H03_06780 [Planctomycetales bacterium 4484_113]
MPTVLRTGPHRFFFFSNEGDEPPHIHIETAENYAKFWLEPVMLARSVGYNASELNQLRKLVEEHRELFLEKWHEFFD